MNIISHLNVRDTSCIPEMDTLEDISKWCFQHDIHPIAPWPDNPNDPHYSYKLTFSSVILRDYINLLVRGSSGIDIDVLVDAISSAILREISSLPRHDDGSPRLDERLEYIKKFRVAESKSVYPFDELDKAIFDESRSADSTSDPRVTLLTDYITHYFPQMCATARRACYDSYDNEIYGIHTESISLVCRRILGLAGLSSSQVNKANWVIRDSLIFLTVASIRPSIKPERMGDHD